VARAVPSGTRADTVLLIASCALALIAIALPGRVRDPIAGTLRRDLVAPLISLQKNAELGRLALMRHDQETAGQDSIALKALLVPSLESENDRLRRLLGLGRALRWGFVPAEALHSRALGEEFTMTLTAGARSGVRPFSAVVAPEGLVGMVETVDPRMCLAISWAHPDFRVSAMTADGSAFGIAKAHLGSGTERYLLELSGVQLSTTLPSGTLIVSSGIGGVYPRGIPVGTVMRELGPREGFTEGWARTYLRRPAVRPQNISSVMILEPRRGAAGVQAVWADSLKDNGESPADSTASPGIQPGTEADSTDAQDGPSR
jgi:rod shape-determining protein MreC